MQCHHRGDFIVNVVDYKKEGGKGGEGGEGGKDAF